ncbi:MAG TPA: hypothetical protein VM141_01620 [Planctomycetota bacterium]|nr:hypothetical protein [Planctomycetota bacterium]
MKAKDPLKLERSQFRKDVERAKREYAELDRSRTVNITGRRGSGRPDAN